MKPYVCIILFFTVLLIACVATQFFIIKYRGSPVAIPDIKRGEQVTGTGPSLRYVIMGDSTAISQGSDYSDGFAQASINHLAQKFTVSSINTAISGAITSEIADQQLTMAVNHRPDIVLLSAGANDTTHLARGATIEAAVQKIINELRSANPNVQIIVTGSPAMDSVTRFPIGSKQIMGLRTKQVNAVFDRLIEHNNLIHAPIAQETRAAFIADPTLTASDQFHPNARGYALWIPVINTAIDKAVTATTDR